MNTAFSLTETVMRHLLCQLMGLNATNASNGNRPSAMKSFLAAEANTMAAAIKASNTGFGFLCAQIAIETRLTLYITVPLRGFSLNKMANAMQWPTTTGRCLTFAAAFTKTISTKAERDQNGKPVYSVD